MSDLVRNPEDQFSQNEAHIIHFEASQSFGGAQVSDP